METLAPVINYYEILEVTPQSTAEEIYNSYQRIKETYSLKNPEVMQTFTLEEVQQLAFLIEDAYATISNPQTREIYNARLYESHTPFNDDRGAISSEDNTTTQEHTISRAAEAKKESTKTTAAEATHPINTTVPSGHARTCMSTYPIDETFEASIQAQDYFDGVLLGKIRKYKKIDLEHFSQRTCITQKYLYAIESNNYSALPAAVFTRGYICQYCKILELDQDKVVSSFMKLFINGRQ